MGAKKRYFSLFTAYMLFTALLAGAELNWASAVGYNIVPLVISYFIIRKATTFKIFIGRSLIVLTLFSALNALEIRERYMFNYSSVFSGCFERNLAVKQMTSELDRVSFCACFSNNVASFAMAQDALIFYGFKSDSNISQSINSSQFLSASFAQCAAAA